MRMTGSGAASFVAQAPDTWDRPPLVAVRRTLANGLRVVLAENHAVPLVWLNWVCQAGFEWDSPALAGVAAMTPSLLREGTAHRSADQITEDVDNLGANLVAGADWDAAFLNLDLLSADFAAGAELLIDMACHPRFPEAAVARACRRQLAEIDRRHRDPRAIADDELARAVHGPNVYGRSPIGTRATLERIDAADVAAFHRARYTPGDSYLVVAGNFDSEEAADLLGSFKLPTVSLASPSSSPALAVDVDPSPGIRVVVVRPATHTELRIGHAGVARDSEDLPALEVLNAVLGRGPSSRLAVRLRQREGLTYHVGSHVTARHRGGHFVVDTGVATHAAPAALAAIRREIDDLREVPVPAAEVEQAKRSLLGAELQRFQNLFGTGVAIGPVALESDPVRHFDRRRQAIAAVEPEALRELARRYLHPDGLVAVVVGPAEVLKSQFRSSGAQGREPLFFESIS